MRYLAMLGADVGVIAVDNDSPIQSLAELNEVMVSDPGSIVTAGSSAVGGWDHLRLLMVAKEAGLDALSDLRWVQFDGGTDAVTQMMGGQIDVVSTDMGEIAGFVESGDIRILAPFRTNAVPAFPDAPTAKEQGFDVTGYNWRGLYTGGHVTDEEYADWVDKLKTLYNSENWQSRGIESGLVPIWRGGRRVRGVRARAERHHGADLARYRRHPVTIRLAGVAIFLIAALFTWVGRGYTATFSDVLGPSVFPVIVGIPTMILSASPCRASRRARSNGRPARASCGRSRPSSCWWAMPGCSGRWASRLPPSV